MKNYIRQVQNIIMLTIQKQWTEQCKAELTMLESEFYSDLKITNMNLQVF